MEKTFEQKALPYRVGNSHISKQKIRWKSFETLLPTGKLMTSIRDFMPWKKKKLAKYTLTLYSLVNNWNKSNNNNYNQLKWPKYE